MAGQRLDRCRQCGFDPAVYDHRDAANTMRALGAMVAYTFESVPDWMVTSRVDRRTWSMAQYLHHVHQVTTQARFRMEVGIGKNSSTATGVRLFRPPAVSVADVPALVAATSAELERIHHLLVEVMAGDDPGRMDRVFPVDRRRRTVRTIMHDLLHECFHHLADIARVRHDLGGMIKLRGRLAGIHSSSGGVPKTRIETARIDLDGVVGDAQAARNEHGRPWQALCVYSADMIHRMAADGHPIAPGTIGENLTLSSIDWSVLRPGLSLRVGGVTCLLTTPADPCAKIRGSFSDGDYGRVDHDKHPGMARWYASVIVPGVIASGDEVVVSSYRPW